jgi:hypothetical protein
MATIGVDELVGASGVAGETLIQDWTSSSVGGHSTIYIGAGVPPNNDGVRPNTTTGYVRCVTIAG